MASAARPPSRLEQWGRLIERVILVTFVALGATTLVAASWSRDMAAPRVNLLGAGRGVSALVTAGSARVLILSGTDPTELGNAFEKAKHPGLDRLDVLIVSGNAAATDVASRTIGLLRPRLVVAVGSSANLESVSIDPGKIIEHTTEMELPAGVLLTIELWPAANGESEDVTWSVMIRRGAASVYWVSDREALMQHGQPNEADAVVVGRGKPAVDTPFPMTRTLATAGESISGPELRALALESIGPDSQTVRIFSGEVTRIDLDPSGIRAVEGSTQAATPPARREVSSRPGAWLVRFRIPTWRAGAIPVRR